MNIGIEVYIGIAVILLYIDLFIIFRLIIRRIKKLDSIERRSKIHRWLYQIVSGKGNKRKIKGGMPNFKKMKEAICFNSKELDKLSQAFAFQKLEKRYKQRLKSWFTVQRIEAAVNLAVIGSDSARLELEKAMLHEKKPQVKLYMANALAEIGNKNSIPILVDSLLNSHRWYREKVNFLICSFEEKFHDFLPELLKKDEIEIKELIVEFASTYIYKPLHEYLITIVDGYESYLEKMSGGYLGEQRGVCFSCQYGKACIPNGDRICKWNGIASPAWSCKHYKFYPSSVYQVENYKKLVYKAARVLAEKYYRDLDDDKYLFHFDVTIRKIAISALAKQYSEDSFLRVLSFIRDLEVMEETADICAQTLIQKPGFIRYVVEVFNDTQSIMQRAQLAEVLTHRIDYFILGLISEKKEESYNILRSILLLGKASPFIWFMNRNEDLQLEKEMIALTVEVTAVSEELRNTFIRYLNSKFLEKCGFATGVTEKKRSERKEDTRFIKTVYLLVTVMFFVFPVVFILRYWNTVFTNSLFQNVRLYITDFNYYLAFYSIAINLIYLLLLFFSFREANLQNKLWSLKSQTMLFKNKMLPSVSVIAPAYNEEKTIVESVTSLLNLRYPDYELIVVNDDSTDKTLDTLIRHFSLERVDMVLRGTLHTTPVRGVYMNPSLPKLLVLDKENGGKADALNAGINISQKDYFCGIDADSLLENDALLKIASLTLDTGVETPALGGNILPINGCTTDKGSIVTFGLGKRLLPKFQMVEYVRAFMNGRLGWSHLDGLLIISGAFGLFRRDRIIAIGGYMTKQEKYGKDTVGEDMEMVVRTRRLMMERGLKHKICFAFDANCWTQVPEDFVSLKRQRERWSRGLADIMVFHKRLIFNPRYGRIGLISMPYFLFFELLGPFVEIQGILMVILAMILGLLNTEMFLLLFVTTVFIGVLVSLASLLLMARGSTVFKTYDFIRLIIYSTLENFGIRQLQSLWRVLAVLFYHRNKDHWEKARRMHFSSANGRVNEVYMTE